VTTERFLILGVCVLLHVKDPGDGGGEALFRLPNVTIVGFYYLLLLKLLHVSVIRPSSDRNIFARTTDPLFLEYSYPYLYSNICVFSG
jgi:hypothetical protein